MQQQRLASRVRVETIDPVVAQWPRGARQTARDVVRRYGLPHEETPSRLIWHYADPWKRVIAHRNGVLHQFPFPHRDYLEQTVNLRVPLERCSELAAFNGSVVVDRTRGEVTVHCSNEAANFLLINLAHDIALGKLTAAEARRACAGAAAAMRMRWPIPYTVGLNFTADVSLREAAGGAGDPDRPVRAMPVWR
jgi:hypothetical protein